MPRCSTVALVPLCLQCGTGSQHYGCTQAPPNERQCGLHDRPLATVK